jgi:hypothetical protein
MRECQLTGGTRVRVPQRDGKSWRRVAHVQDHALHLLGKRDLLEDGAGSDRDVLARPAHCP